MPPQETPEPETPHTTHQEPISSEPVVKPVIEPADTMPTTSQEPVKRHRSKKWALLIVVIVLLVGGASAGAIVYKKHQDNTKKAAALLEQTLHTPNPTITPSTDLTAGRAFLRYTANSAYQIDDTGKVKTVVDADGSNANIRKDSFTVSVESNGSEHPITLDKSILEFGTSTTGEFYALSCSVPAVGQPGGDNISYIAQFYDKTGTKTKSETYTEQGITAPDGHTPYCNSGYFSVNNTGPVDFAARNFGREAIDTLNYKVVYKSADGTKHTIDNETAADIDVPLGVSPDKKTFMYARISAMRTQAGCGEETQLAYKIPDFSGPINELHAVTIATGNDVNLGSESSFGVDRHEISTTIFGHFSSDDARYYLTEGVHGGCRGGDSVPIRIAYIDMNTGKLQTISSPAGKEYSAYAFTDDGKYAIEFGAVDDFDPKTPAKTPDVPTILNTKDGSTFQISGIDGSFGGGENGYPGLDQTLPLSPNTWLSYDKTTYHKDGDTTSDALNKTLNGLSTVDPIKRSVTKVTFDNPIDLQTNDLTGNAVQRVGSTNVGYVNRTATYNGKTQTYDAPPATILFDIKTGKTVSVPNANLVL